MRRVIMKECGGPEVLHVVTEEIPTVSSNDFLIRIHYAGIAHPDLLIRTGQYPWTKGKLPIYPGVYASGEIIDKGDEAKGFDIGDRVYIRHPIVCGCYSEYKIAPANCIIKIPPEMDMKIAAICHFSVIAWCMLKECFPDSEGKTLYIKGAAGSIGTAIIQIAPILGIRVIASASSEEKCQYLRSLGNVTVFNYKEKNEIDEIMQFTEGHGVDIVMDQLVGPNFTKQLDLLNDLGTILIYNNICGMPNDEITEALTKRFAKSLAVRAFSFHYYDDKPELLKKRASELLNLIVNGEVNPHIGGEYNLDDVVEAHTFLDSGKLNGAIVLNCM